MNYIAKSIVFYLNTKSCNKIQHIDWCIYALEKILYKALNFIIVAIISLFLGFFIESCIVFFTINYLRKKISGWHANNAIVCVFLTVTLNISIPILSLYLSEYYYSLLIIFILNIILLTQFNQIDDPKLKLSQEELLENKRQARIRIVIVLVISSVVHILFSMNIAINMQLATFVAIISTFIKKESLI